MIIGSVESINGDIMILFILCEMMIRLVFDGGLCSWFLEGLHTWSAVWTVRVYAFGEYSAGAASRPIVRDINQSPIFLIRNDSFSTLPVIWRKRDKIVQRVGYDNGGSTAHDDCTMSLKIRTEVCY